MSLNTTYMGGGWGYGPGWGWGGGMGGMGSSTTSVRNYSVATVVLDLWDAKQKRLVWRGTVSDTMSDNPHRKTPRRSTPRPRSYSRTICRSRTKARIFPSVLLSRGARFFSPQRQRSEVAKNSPVE